MEVDRLPLRTLATLAVLTAFASGGPATASGKTRTISLDSGGRLHVPAGALDRGVYIKTSYGWPARGKRGYAVKLRLTGRRGHLRLRRAVTLEFPALYGAATQIRTYDSKRRKWRRLTTRYDAARNTVSARLWHFSWFDPVVDPLVDAAKALVNNTAQFVGEKVGTRTDPPACRETATRSNRLPPWVQGLDTASGPNDPLPACGQSEGDVLAVEFVNNRPYGIILRYAAPVAWGWTRLGFPLRDLATQRLNAGRADGLYLPAVSEGSVGIPQGEWSSATFRAGVSGLSLVADVTEAAVMAVSAADRRLVRQTASRALKFMTAECVVSLAEASIPDSPTELGKFIVNHVDCIDAAVLEAVKRGVFDGLRISSIDDLRKVLRAIKVASALEIANRFLELLRDAHVGSFGSFTVRATPRQTQPAAPPANPPASGQPAPTPAPPRPAATRVNPYDNYGPATQGHLMCRGNPGRPESQPGGTATQTFTVPGGVASVDHAMVQIDPAAAVTAHATLSVNGTARASTATSAAGDTHFSFSPVAVAPGDEVKLSITFSASEGKLIAIYAAAVVGGAFTAQNSCSDGAQSFSKANGLRAVVSGWST